MKHARSVTRHFLRLGQLNGFSGSAAPFHSRFFSFSDADTSLGGGVGGSHAACDLELLELFGVGEENSAHCNGPIPDKQGEVFPGLGVGYFAGAAF
jgi:hypothetical protein